VTRSAVTLAAVTRPTVTLAAVTRPTVTLAAVTPALDVPTRACKNVRTMRTTTFRRTTLVLVS